MAALHHLRAAALSLLLATCAALAGCGGGDPEDDPNVPTPGVNCPGQPEVCR